MAARPVNETEQAQADIIESGGKAEVTECEYDRTYARAHKANKYSVLILFIALVVPAFSLEPIADTLERILGIKAGYYAGLGIMILDLVLTAAATAAIVLLFPFLTASGAVWHIVKNADGIILIRLMPYGILKQFAFLPLDGIASVRHDRWVIYYLDARGKRRKQTIARAYPKLDEFLSEQKNR